ncbi:MAG: hypothetical protein ACP5FH_01375 [Terracidiphilus sp.]
MLKISLVLASLGFAAALSSPLILQAQSSALAPDAPLPAQILTARKVFIAYGGGTFDPGLFNCKAQQAYNEFYASVKQWGHYEFVSTPGEADLVLQVSGADPMASVMVYHGYGYSTDMPQLWLALLDPKTGIRLWSFEENISIKLGRHKNHNTCFGIATDALVGDLKALTARAEATTK